MNLSRRIAVTSVLVPIAIASLSVIVLFARIGASFRPTGQVPMLLLAGSIAIWSVSATVALSKREGDVETAIWRSFLISAIVMSLIVTFSIVSVEYAVATLRPGFSMAGCDFLVLPPICFVAGVATYFVMKAVLTMHSDRIKNKTT